MICQILTRVFHKESIVKLKYPNNLPGPVTFTPKNNIFGPELQLNEVNQNLLPTSVGFQDSRLPRQGPNSIKHGDFAEEGLDIGAIALAGEKCIDKVTTLGSFINYLMLILPKFDTTIVIQKLIPSLPYLHFIINKTCLEQVS